MAQRGRKPAIRLLPPLVPGQGGHPPPPSELDQVEAKYWRAVIDALPAFWVDGAGKSSFAVYAPKLPSWSARKLACGHCGPRVRILARSSTSSPRLTV